MNVSISYPFSFTGERLGRMWYPRKAGRISIYLADHSKLYKGNMKRISKELSVTILEELTHAFHDGNSPAVHHFDKFLYKLVSREKKEHGV